VQRIDNLADTLAKQNSVQGLLLTCFCCSRKTNVAMLTVVSHLKRVGLIGYENRDSDDTGKKIVYIAPMKALAQEIVEKFSEKLKPLGMVVRELTGDMQLTRAAAEAANILVTTPEKWDGRSTHAHCLLWGLVLLMRYLIWFRL